MKTYQSYNKKTKAWVKYNKYADGKCKITDVKQKEPQKPFKGVPKRGAKK
jgi:hypothetical protein